MAIGTAAAIGLGVAGIGSALSSSSNRRAADRAADTSLQVAQQNNTLARENRDLMLNRADPFINSGMQANALINSMLGIAAPQQQPQPLPSPLGPSVRPVGLDSSFGGLERPMMTPMTVAAAGRRDGTFAGTMQPIQSGPQPTAPAAPNGQDAFRNFIANSDYAFQFGEGSNAINSGYAGAGTLQSGAAMRDMERFRQNLQSGYRGEFMDRLSGQQGVGLSALGSAAGVGTNYVNQVSANNNNAGTAAANALLARGNNNPFANALGVIGGGILGRG